MSLKMLWMFSIFPDIAVFYCHNNTVIVRNLLQPHQLFYLIRSLLLTLHVSVVSLWTVPGTP
jgi:hypothetical protein